MVIPYVQQLWEKQQLMKNMKKSAATTSALTTTDTAKKNEANKMPRINYPKQPNLTCPHVELLRYWKEPSDVDWSFETEYMKESKERALLRSQLIGNEDPLHNYYHTDERYVTFEPDHGGWNNIRYMNIII